MSYPATIASFTLAGLQAPRRVATLQLTQVGALHASCTTRTAPSAPHLTFPRLHANVLSPNKAPSFAGPTCHTAPFSTTNMSSRGKKRLATDAAHAAPLAPPGAPQHGHEYHVAVPPPEKDYQQIVTPNPRRSSRRSITANGAPDKGTAAFPHARDIENLKSKTMNPKKGAKRLDKQIRGAQEAVGDTIQSLEALELAFKRDVKRRKLQVETSTITHPGDDMPGALHPRMKRGSSDTVQPTGLFITPDPETEPKVETGDALEGILEAERDAHDDVVEAADRGAKRPPPVNSDFLPLPWKGRLGYVGHHPAHCEPQCSWLTAVRHA